jgi:hypothetical protein
MSIFKNKKFTLSRLTDEELLELGQRDALLMSSSNDGAPNQEESSGENPITNRNDKSSLEKRGDAILKGDKATQEDIATIQTYGNVLGQELAAKAQTYGAEKNLEGTKRSAEAQEYASDRGKEGQIEAARLGAYAQVEAAEISAEAQMYGADRSKEAQITSSAVTAYSQVIGNNPIIESYRTILNKVTDPNANDKLSSYLTLNVIAPALDDAQKEILEFNEKVDKLAEDYIKLDYYTQLEDYKKKNNGKTAGFKPDENRDYSFLYAFKQDASAYSKLTLDLKTMADVDAPTINIANLNSFRVGELGFARQNPGKGLYSDFQLYYVENAGDQTKVLQKDDFSSEAKKVVTEQLKDNKGKVIGKNYFFENADGSRTELTGDQRANLYAMPDYMNKDQKLFVMVREDVASDAYYTQSLGKTAADFSGLLNFKDPFKNREWAVKLSEFADKSGPMMSMILKAIISFIGGKKSSSEEVENVNSGVRVAQNELSPDSKQLNSVLKDFKLTTDEKQQLSAMDSGDVLKALSEIANSKNLRIDPKTLETVSKQFNTDLDNLKAPTEYTAGLEKDVIQQLSARQ